MKRIAPIIVTILILVYLSFYLGVAIFTKDNSSIGKTVLVILGIGSLSMMIAMIATLITRLKEIKKEEKDDLSKY
jgi:hypothetical protein